jgi:hypothetical protein
MLDPDRRAIKFYPIAHIGTAIPAFQIKRTVSTIAAVSIKAAKPSRKLIADMEHASRICSEQPL